MREEAEGKLSSRDYQAQWNHQVEEVHVNKLAMDDPRPTSRIKVGGVDTMALWDTGSAITLIDKSILKQMKVMPEAH